jgi:TolB protein
VAPDGKTFVYNGGGELYRRNIDGSNPEQLTFTGTDHVFENGPDFSPDGKRLVFSTFANGQSDIYLMKAEPEGPNNPRVNLTAEVRTPSGESSLEKRPTWSPDGQEISFWSFVSGQGYDEGEIYAIRADGSDVRNLTDNYNPAAQIGDIMPDWGPVPSRDGRP